MLKIFLLFAMLFLHIVDDYYLQGILASMKQKKWWEENAPDELYKKDYIIALLEHAFSWTFMIMLIPAIYILINNIHGMHTYYFFVFFVNWVVHCKIDDLKANQKSINLIQDQMVHILQVTVTWFFFILLL